MRKVAPTLIVDRIEPTLAFFTERLGFQKITDVPGDDGELVFAMVTAGEVEVHFQSRASAGRDLPYLSGATLPPSSFLYFDVEDVHALWEKLQDCEILAPLEKKFYGATDFFVKEPGGHVLGFSQNL